VIKALLFDLDDTLLGSDLGTFLPAYFQALVQHLALGSDGQRFIAELVNGTRAMRANADPTRTLRAVFNDRFFPAMHWDARTWTLRFDEFYWTRFPQLQSLTTRRPAARPVLEWAFAAGQQVTLATSPLFPPEAILERMRWAGIDDLPFARVTHMDNSHFARPNPEYFAEIIAALNLRPEEALVIGNDWADDIAPAALAGLPQFWIAPAGSAPPDRDQPNRLHPVGIGDLGVFLEWAQSVLPTFNPPPAPSPALPYQLIGNLAATLSALENLPGGEWTRRPAEAEWSITEIVCHLRDVEAEVHLPRLRTLLEADNPFISGADTDPWAVKRDYQSQSGTEALQAFVAARRQTHAFLAELPESDWNRPARHAIFGPTHLAEIVGWMLGHDRIHLDQLRAMRRKIETAA
jgi:FMN phosphatase YigB (HAD superfamily)